MLKLKYPLILASRSPRRQQLLKDLGIRFSVEIVDADETYPPDIQIADIPVYLAKKKAETLRQVYEDHIILTADTIVVQGDDILGKPESAEDAANMLQQLSGRTHKVYTGVCLILNNNCNSLLEVTEVTFNDLSKGEIDYYIRNFHPLDKAGAYGIQEWIGLVGIAKIEGSYTNVVGLPVNKVFEELKKLHLVEFEV